MDAITILKSVAQYGHAPQEGCKLFGAIYDDAFARLKKEYLFEQFEAGSSNEKFVIGPFGSGKTHFLRQFMEIARDEECVTSEVMLNKDLVFTDNIAVYCEVARAIRVPGRSGHGIRNLLLASLDQVAKDTTSNEEREYLVNSWIKGLPNADFKESKFARMVGFGLDSYQRREIDTFEAVCRWLSGEVTDAILSKQLSIARIQRNEQAGFGRRMLLSLCQFIKYAGFRGTVIAFDEAEQGLARDSRQRERILSMLQSGINAFADLNEGSALIMYGITPDLAERFDSFAALQQRLADPLPGEGFFDGTTLSPKIDLTLRKEPYEDLKAMGYKFIDMFYESAGTEIETPIEDVRKVIEKVAREVFENDLTTSNRRDMAKRTAALLLNLYQSGVLEVVTPVVDEEKESEV